MIRSREKEIESIQKRIPELETDVSEARVWVEKAKFALSRCENDS